MREKSHCLSLGQVLGIADSEWTAVTKDADLNEKSKRILARDDRLGRNLPLTSRHQLSL